MTTKRLKMTIKGHKITTKIQTAAKRNIETYTDYKKGNKHKEKMTRDSK